MAKESVKILRGKLDVDNLLSQLNAALAEEWLAYYQYWVGALVVEGAMRSDYIRSRYRSFLFRRIPIILVITVVIVTATSSKESKRADQCQ